jgi:molecular chaperone HtpG
MSTNIVPITLREPSWQQLADEIVIGKDILELLSTSMYVDPMTIYREYVQNAADAIDEARSVGDIATGEPGRVEIEIDPATRTAKVTDNGTGIPFEDFARRLSAFGGSKKRGRGARGFRGVGRLAGIGYCQELVFRTRVKGDSKVSELRWDCRKLKSILRSTEAQHDLRQAVAQIVEVRRTTATDRPQRFFEVELRGIVRHRNDQLLNPAAVSTYLSQVAPVPFRDDFPYRDRILQHLGAQVELGDLEVSVSGNGGPVRRPHSSGIEVAEGVVDPFSEVELIKIDAVDEGIAAMGWILHHGYTGALPASCHVRGLRVRCGNIQVGDERMFEELFPETRFNAWSVGELHVVDPRIVPNGRRDHFEQSTHFHNLLTHLTPCAREIARRCRTSSVRRKWSRDFELREAAVRGKIAILKQGAVSRRERNRLAEAIRTDLGVLEEIIRKGILPDEELNDLRKRKEKIDREVGRVLNAPVKASVLSDFASAKRSAYEQVIGLIYECSASQANAKLLVDKILAKLR